MILAATGGQAVKAGGIGGGRSDKEGGAKQQQGECSAFADLAEADVQMANPHTGRQQSAGESLPSLTRILLIGDPFQETKVPIVKVAEGPKKANPETPKIVAEPKGKDKPQPNKKPPVREEASAKDEERSEPEEPPKKALGKQVHIDL